MDHSLNTMPKDPADELNIETIQTLLDEEETDVQNLFKRALNIYVSNDSTRKTSEEKMEFLKKVIEESLK